MATAMLWQRSIGLHWCSKATASACFCAMGLFNGHTVLYCTVPLRYYTLPPKVTSESSIIPAAYASAASGETAKAGVTVEVTISFKGSQSVSPNDGFYFLFGAALRIWSGTDGTLCSAGAQLAERAANGEPVTWSWVQLPPDIRTAEWVQHGSGPV